MSVRSSRSLSWLDAVIAMGLALLFAWACHQLALPGLVGLMGDDAIYANYGRALANGFGFVDTMPPDHVPATLYPMGFPLIVAASFWGVTDLSEQVARLIWISPIFGGLFIALIFAYFRRFARLPIWLATLMTVAIATNPTFLSVGTYLLSDFPFAVVGLLAIMVLEYGDGQTSPSPWIWLAGGALIGSACMLRYTGVALILAAWVALAQARKWSALGLLSMGFALVFAPWMGYRAIVGGETYHSYLLALIALDPGTVVSNLGLCLSYFVGNGLPGVIAPGLFNGQAWPLFLAGSAVTGVVLLGAFTWLRKPGEGQTPLPAAYMVLTAAMIVTWGIVFVSLGPELLSRLLIPVAPFVFLALLRGIHGALASFSGRIAGLERPLFAVLFSVLTVVGGRHVAGAIADDANRGRNLRVATAYEDFYAFIRSHTSADARMLSLSGPMLHFYTHRSCVRLNDELAAERVLHLIDRARIDYLVGTPFLLLDEHGPSSKNGQPGKLKLVDQSKIVINRFVTAYPGVLKPTHFGETGSMAIFKVEKSALAMHLRPRR